MSTATKTYLYDRKGPWPQPSPNHPLGEAPAVLHLPPVEISQWKANIGSRYTRTVFTYWPTAGLSVLREPSIEEVPDAEFDRLFNHTPFGRFMRPVVAADYQGPFQALLADPAYAYLLADFSLMRNVEPFEGLYIAPTQVLLRYPAGADDQRSHKETVAIYLPFSNLLLNPSNGAAWDLAKYYVLQGANYRLVLSVHSVLHFPFDCINAITKTQLPMQHTVWQLLMPHLAFTLVVNNAVLESDSSPIFNNQWLPYSAMTGRKEGFEELLVAAYEGLPDLPASYPPFRYTLRPDKVYTDYGLFLDAYYDTIYDFTAGVVAALPPHELREIGQWARQISFWLPDFPDEQKILEVAPSGQREVLAGTLAKIIWDLSVSHGADHYNYSLIPVRKIPMRLRVAPPSTPDAPSFQRADLSTRLDIFKHLYLRQMFFRAVNVSLLCDTDYQFGHDHLRGLQTKFHQQLRDTEARLRAQNVQLYIPLAEIPRSIQY